MCRVKTQWAKQGHQFAVKEIRQPRELRFIPMGAAHEVNVFLAQCRNQLFIQQFVLAFDQCVCGGIDLLQGYCGRQAIRADGGHVQLQLLFQAGNTDFKKLIHIRAGNAQKA